MRPLAAMLLALRNIRYTQTPLWFTAAAFVTLNACAPAPVISTMPPAPPADVRVECAVPELVETDLLQIAVTLAAAFGRCRSAALFNDEAWRKTAAQD